MSEPCWPLRIFPALLLIVAVSAGGCATSPSQPLPALRAEANRFNERGIEAARRGDLPAAASSLAEAYRCYAAMEHHPGMVTTLLNSARVSMRQGESDKARQALDRAEGLLPFTPELTAEVLFEKGKFLLHEGQVAEAARLSEKALQSAEPGSKGRMANLLARVRVREGKREAAAEMARNALALARETGDRQEEANALRLLGESALARGGADEATQLYSQAMLVDKEVAAGAKIAADLQGLAQAAEASGRKEAALAFWQRAATVHGARHDRHAEAFSLERQALLYGQLGDDVNAALARERARSLISGQ